MSLEWIKNQEVWDKMIEDRNLTSHTYKERTAIEVYEAFREEYYPAFLYFKEQIAKVVEEIERSS